MTKREQCLRNVSAIAAKRRAATHCKRNHAFTVENTYWRRDGRRCCRTCLYDRGWYFRRGLKLVA